MKKAGWSCDMNCLVEALNVILSGRASPRMGGQERATGSGGVGGVCADHIGGVCRVWIYFEWWFSNCPVSVSL